MSSKEELKPKIRAALVDLLVDAIGTDRLVAEDELVKAGIPSRYVAGIARESHAITTQVEAVNSAEEWADLVSEWMAERDALSVDDVVKKVGRL